MIYITFATGSWVNKPKLPPKTSPMRILIADDHTLIREGLRKILVESFPFADIFDVADSADLLKKALNEKWDIISSDISMPGYSGIEILKQIKEHAPQTPVLMLSMHAPEQYAVRSLKARCFWLSNQGKCSL